MKGRDSRIKITGSSLAPDVVIGLVFHLCARVYAHIHTHVHAHTHTTDPRIGRLRKKGSIGRV